MTEPLGDLAERIAQRMSTDTSAPVEEASAIAEEAALQASNDIFTKIRFSWRPEDRAILDRIRIAADAMFEEAFGDIITVIDEFYEQLRIPEQRDGIVVRGADGRVVWQKNERGQVIENWDQLTGQDIEQTLANLARLRFEIAPQVNQLMLEALFARYGATDAHDAGWAKVYDGTVGDKNATANRESVLERYHAYFRFYFYSLADTFLKEITAFQKLLTDIRYWQVRTQKG